MRALGFEVSFYPVDGQAVAHPDPSPGEAVLLIHYFGWESAVAGSLMASGSFFLIDDLSHSVLSAWSGNSPMARCFFSARKLAPIPLGGWCNLSVTPGSPSARTEAIAWRSFAASLLRQQYLRQPAQPVDNAVEELYLSAFRRVEEELALDTDDYPIPGFVLDLAAGMNWSLIAERRRENWAHLDQLIQAKVERLATTLPEDVVPLGYVIRLDERRRDTVRARLARRRLFCPVHWPLPVEVDGQRFPDADRLSKTLLTLPIDQRYDASDMATVAELVLEAIEST